MLFVFFYHNAVNVAEPGNSAIVDPSSGEMPPNWSDILVHIRVFILLYTHFSLYFDEVMAGLKPAWLLLRSSD